MEPINTCDKLAGDQTVNLYIDLAVFSVNLIGCGCYVNYEQFRGFDAPTTEARPHSTRSTRFTHTPHTSRPHVYVHTHSHSRLITSTHRTHNPETTTVKLKSVNNTPNKKDKTKVTARNNMMINSTDNSLRSVINSTRTINSVTTTEGEPRVQPKIKVKEFKRKCPETEKPFSIGTYEIPTERDLVLFTKRTLLKMFNTYHEKTLYLLKDIKEATRATIEVEKKCHGQGKSLYKKCVKQVSKKCVTITKELVATLERQEAEVIALTEDKICNMTSMRTDPILLIKRLAMDEATLSFALPAFLRLLGECATNCHKPSPPDHRPRLRQLTDQDLVVRHFLTSKNYVQLIKDTHTYV